MSDEKQATLFEREKARLIKEIAATTEEVMLLMNNINRSQQSTLTLARDKASGEMFMWKHLLDLGQAKAKERARDEGLSASVGMNNNASTNAPSNPMTSSGAPIAEEGETNAEERG